MKKDLKEKWVAALRSGKYLQADGALRKIRNDGKQGYCCLGVLCEISGIGKWVDGGYYGTYDVGNRTLSGTLEGALSKFGFTQRTQLQLVNMNDGGADFAEIADYIERKLYES